MIITAIKTQKILSGSKTIYEVLDESLPKLEENSVVAISSKVVAICEGRTVPVEGTDKNTLVRQESDYFLPEHMSQYGFSFTITHNTLIPAAGIDESNGNGSFVLWPKDPQESANQIRRYLLKRAGIKHLGVVITDSTARPLHYGTEGISIAYSGFSALNNYIGKPDLFGRELKVSVANIADALAAAAVLVTGEGTEQTPIALIGDVPFVDFQDHEPTKDELSKYYVHHMEDDMFAPFLQNMGWKKGGRT